MKTVAARRHRPSLPLRGATHPRSAKHRKAEADAVEPVAARAPARRPTPRDGAAIRESEIVVLRTVLVVGSAAVAALAWWIASDAARAIEPELARLLRGMAALKGLVAAAAAGVVWWRLGQPSRLGVAVTYIACTGALWTATALIWQLAFIPAAAVLFHVAGFVGLVLALREGRGRLAPA